MMKYELALVLSAKIEDEERAAMVEKNFRGFIKKACQD